MFIVFKLNCDIKIESLIRGTIPISRNPPAVLAIKVDFPDLPLHLGKLLEDLSKIEMTDPPTEKILFANS